MIGENIMDNTNYIALSRQMALWKQMDILSNNMANMNTSGYKQDQALFTSYMVETPDAQGIGSVPLYFTEDFGSFQNFAEGAIVETGNTFDLAIKGDAFFCLETKAGEMYTRKGNFTLNSEGMLVSGDGDAVLSENNEPLFFAPGESEITITESGDVITENGLVGRLKLVSFADNQKLLKIAGTMFENVDGNPMEIGADNIVIAQGAIEKSNVNPIEEMTRLINVQRSYEYVQQMIDEEHERLSNTISTYAQLA
ncbi:MAG: flagellar basal-body rod protein FlgF [Alphaproteobacteria bacterium]|nr:flagellar basal-body rod protein FlgF [Alphaproteobacteria bacterium]